MKAIPGKRKRDRSKQSPGKRPGQLSDLLGVDMVVKLYELLEGERDLLQFYSKSLESEICVINTALRNPADLNINCPLYTTDELAFILSLTAEELRRFHYFKMRLID